MRKELLERILTNDSTLKRLDLNYKRALNTSDLALLKNNTYVKSLTLRHTTIRGGAKVLAEVLKINSHLQTLDLYNTGLCDSGAIAIAESLLVNTSLVNLCIGSNHICLNGIAAFAKALENNSTLEVLDLSSNWIQDKEAQVIADIIRTNSTLKVLNLQSNHFSIKGATYLIKALKYNMTIQQIKLDGNKFLRTNTKQEMNLVLDFKKVLNLLLKRNQLLEKFKQYRRLIQVFFANKGLYNRASYYYVPLSLRVLCGIKLSSTLKQVERVRRKQIKYSVSQLPEDIKVIVFELDSLVNQLTRLFGDNTIPTYGIEIFQRKNDLANFGVKKLRM